MAWRVLSELSILWLLSITLKTISFNLFHWYWNGRHLVQHHLYFIISQNNASSNNFITGRWYLDIDKLGICCREWLTLRPIYQNHLHHFQYCHVISDCMYGLPKFYLNNFLSTEFQLRCGALYCRSVAIIPWFRAIAILWHWNQIFLEVSTCQCTLSYLILFNSHMHHSHFNIWYTLSSFFEV